MDVKLNPPIVENIIPAQSNQYGIMVPFIMNKSVGMAEVKNIKALIKTVQTNTEIAQLTCSIDNVSMKNHIYYAYFSNITPLNFQIGQHYKIQLAYESTTGLIGFYSSTATFKFTANPNVTIQDLDLNEINTHIYDYTGVYHSIDQSEKVYSYQFELYSIDGSLIASSGEMLHNSATDTETNRSIDKWTTRQGLEPGEIYTIVYKGITINGLEFSSPAYKINYGCTVPSNLLKYYDFVATNEMDEACVALSLQPKTGVAAADRKLINGKFVLLRASSEDNYQSWYEMTRFILASWDSAKDKFLCKDYSVSQGIGYQYAIQAYNTQGVYSTRQETQKVFVDFEDMFLSDGERQLRIRFNPKVSSFKTTLLESKLDTLGGKYPFFFRNGNVNYKEFPISGLISMLADENEQFMKGIQVTDNKRHTTPSDPNRHQDLSTWLTGNNFKKERDFKIEVLNWLTNGKPKLFRSPGEGSYIVRLMNTSLSPTDALGRMIHTFSSTAYEMADFTFENLRKYNMLMDDYIETRELRTYTKDLYKTTNGSLSGLNACMAVLHANPGTEFRFKLMNDKSEQIVTVGHTGVYSFSSSVLQENPLIYIAPKNNKSDWFPSATFIYSVFDEPELDSFSYLHSVQVNDVVSQWIGRKVSEIPTRYESQSLRKTSGLVYYLNISKRDIIMVDSVQSIGGGAYKFIKNKTEHKPTPTEIVCYIDPSGHENYYDGRDSKLIVNEIDYRVRLRAHEEFIDLQGTGYLTEKNNLFEGSSEITFTGGRIVLTNVQNVDDLYLGNGVYVDIAYQEITKIYTTETTPGSLVKIAKDKWLLTQALADYETYYNLLKNAVKSGLEDLIIDVI